MTALVVRLVPRFLLMSRVRRGTSCVVAFLPIPLPFVPDLVLSTLCALLVSMFPVMSSMSGLATLFLLMLRHCLVFVIPRLFAWFLMPDMISIFAVCSARPIYGDLPYGMVLYISIAIGDFMAEPTRYLSIVSVPGLSTSELVFQALRSYGVYSYQWLTYYLTGGCDDIN